MVISSYDFLTSLYHYYYQMTEAFVSPETSDDLDYLLFHAQASRDMAKVQLREAIDNFFETEYGEIVSGVSIASTKKLNDMHRFIKSMGRECRGSLMDFLQFRNEFRTFPIMYENMKEIFVTYDLANTITEEQLLHWGEHMRTEILNDGFCDNAIYNNIANLACTLAYIDACK